MVESSSDVLDDLTAASESLSSHVKQVVAAFPVETESCQKAEAVKGLEYALKGKKTELLVTGSFISPRAQSKRDIYI